MPGKASYHPPCAITPAVLNLVAEISELVDIFESTPQVTRLVGVLREHGEAMSRAELQSALDLKDRKSFRLRYLQPVLDAGLVVMTIPDKPNSRLQQYRIAK